MPAFYLHTTNLKAVKNPVLHSFMKKQKVNDGVLKLHLFLLLQTNSEGVKMKELYFIYLAILRKVANHVALLQSTAGTSKKQVETCCPVTDLVYLFVYLFILFFQTITSSRGGMDSQLQLICFF